MATNEVSALQTMIVTNLNSTFVWYPPSFIGQRQLVDITDKRWSIIDNDCQSWPEVVNCLKAHGHDIVDMIEVDD